MQTRPFVTMSALVLAALGCREEMESPTAPHLPTHYEPRLPRPLGPGSLAPTILVTSIT